MRALSLLLILLAAGALAWLLQSGEEEGALDDAPGPVAEDGDATVPTLPAIREEGPSGPEPIGLLRPDAPEAQGPTTLPPGVLIRLPERRQGTSGLTGRQVLDAVSRVVPIRGRTEDDLRALEALDMDEGWGDRPDPVPLEEILAIWTARGIDVRPKGRVLVVVERRHDDPRADDGR